MCAWLPLLAVVMLSAAPAQGQLVDRPLSLPGRVRPGVAAAAASPAPVERWGYFSPPSAPQRRLFYWFYQARDPVTGVPKTASSTPLILWANGGPGCSSLWGMFFENGPYTLDSELRLQPNNYTWADVGHMLYIDQPIGTGLSYSLRPGDQTASELDVASTVVSFFQAFFKAPAYASLAHNPLYITGESFAGHYLPSIAAYMKLAAPSMRLVGVAMGNPCTNGPAMYQSYADYAVTNGLMTQEQYQGVQSDLATCKLQAAVCGVLDRTSCPAASDTCDNMYWNEVISNSLLGFKNIYNVKDTAKDCYGSNDVPNCYSPLDARAEAYINGHRAKLGFPDFITYQACANQPYYSLVGDMVLSYDALVAALLDNGVQVMVYSGEDDFICNWMSSKQWIDGLVWSKQALWAKAVPQTWAGGSFRRVGPLSFVRVQHAGHMVPLDQPATMLQLLRQWIAQGQPMRT